MVEPLHQESFAADQPVLCKITEPVLIEVAGSDSETFLNAQFSRNVETGRPLRATLAGWHDARGRVLALMWTVRTGDRWLILANGGDSGFLLRRLSMYVLRADVRIRDVARDWQAAALVGSGGSLVSTSIEGLGKRTGDATFANGIAAIRVGPRLVYVAAREGRLEAVREQFKEGAPNAAALEEIRLGLVKVGPQLRGRYTAHMLNLDRLGAVSFDKGCYPGQEIIARTENLGEAKRRVFRFSSAAGPVPAIGSAVIDADGNSVGEVVRAAPDAGGRVELLAVVRVKAAPGAITVAGADDVPWVLEKLPEAPSG